MKRLAAMVAALVLVVAACGDDDDSPVDVSTGDDPTGQVDDQPGDEPADSPADDPADSEEPPVAGACAEEDPDCDDTVEPGEPVGEDPAPEPGYGTSSGLVVNGGLTISEALSTDATGTRAIQGFVFADGDGIRLCEALAESFPPQCGGASLTVDSASVDDLDLGDVPLAFAQGVNWTDAPVTLFGELVDGIFVVDPLTTG